MNSPYQTRICTHCNGFGEEPKLRASVVLEPLKLTFRARLFLALHAFRQTLRQRVLDLEPIDQMGNQEYWPRPQVMELFRACREHMVKLEEEAGRPCRAWPPFPGYPPPPVLAPEPRRVEMAEAVAMISEGATRAGVSLQEAFVRLQQTFGTSFQLSSATDWEQVDRLAKLLREQEGDPPPTDIPSMGAPQRR